MYSIMTVNCIDFECDENKAREKYAHGQENKKANEGKREERKCVNVVLCTERH